jgi:hypothetical protein
LQKADLAGDQRIHALHAAGRSDDLDLQPVLFEDAGFARHGTAMEPYSEVIATRSLRKGAVSAL